MSYKSFSEQVSEHLNFLQSHQLDVLELQVDAGYVRCHGLEGPKESRGGFCYKSTSSTMQNGLCGLITWCRSAGGEASFRTYGLPSQTNEQIPVAAKPTTTEALSQSKHEAAARKAYGYWINSSTEGASNYLKQKNVGAYGLRFRASEDYGRVALVPMVDDGGRFWSYQLLNPNGTKRHPKGARTEGLFHCLSPLANGRPIGIAESYVTAAACYELIGVSMVCAFSCHNLSAVTQILRRQYPNSPIFLFADNDRHLDTNQGVLKAQEACKTIQGRVALVVPDFRDCEPCKSTSDWNDLIRIKGREEALNQVIIQASDLLENTSKP